MSAFQLSCPSFSPLRVFSHQGTAWRRMRCRGCHCGLEHVVILLMLPWISSNPGLLPDDPELSRRGEMGHPCVARHSTMRTSHPIIPIPFSLDTDDLAASAILKPSEAPEGHRRGAQTEETDCSHTQDIRRMSDGCPFPPRETTLLPISTETPTWHPRPHPVPCRCLLQDPQPAGVYVNVPAPSSLLP